MNILIINHYAGAPGLGREVRPYFLAHHWQEAGHRVTIATADHSHLRQVDPVEGRDPEKRRLGGVDYLFFATPRYNDSVAGRGRNIAAFVRALWQHAPKLAEELRPDVVVVQSGYPYDFFPARRIAALAGAKTVLEVRDLWPLHLQEHYRYRPGHPAVHFAVHALGRAVGTADLVVSVLPLGLRYLGQLGLAPEKSCVIPAGIAAGQKSTLPAGLAQRLGRLKQQGLLVMYCGNLGANHNLSPFVQSAALLGRYFRLVLVGNGGNKITLKRSARQQGLENLFFLDGVQPGQMQAVLEQADVLYFPARRLEQNRYGVASAKLLGYMLSGRPVIFDGAVAQNPVEQCGCGVVLGGGEPREIAGAIRMLGALGEEKRCALGRHGREYVLQHRDYALLAGRYLRKLEELYGNTKNS